MMYGCAVLHARSGAVLSEHNHFGVQSVAQDTLEDDMMEHVYFVHTGLICVLYELDPQEATLLDVWFAGVEGSLPFRLDHYADTLPGNFDNHVEVFLGHLKQNRLPQPIPAGSSAGIVP